MSKGTKESSQARRIARSAGIALLLGGGLSGAAALAQTSAGASGDERNDAAESEVESIVVTGSLATANSRAIVEPLVAQRDVTKSVSIVSGEELESLVALNVTDVFQRLGSIRRQYGNPTTGGITVRGITTSASGSTVDPSLGITVDGVPYGVVPLAVALDYVDVDTISIARGPQGSEGGQNTTTGTLSVVSKAPTFTPEVRGSVVAGADNALITQFAVGGPIIDGRLAYRATLARNQKDGEFYNALPDNDQRHTWGNSDRTFARLQFLYTPSENLDILVSANQRLKGIEYDNGIAQQLEPPEFYDDGRPTYIPNGQPGATNTVRNKLTRDYFTQVDPNAYQKYLTYPVYTLHDKGQQIGTGGGVIKVDWRLPQGTFRSISGYQDHDYQAANSSTAWDVTLNGGYQIRYEQVSQELSFSSNRDGFINYTTGLYFFDSNAEQNIRSRFGSDAGAYNANAAQYNVLASNIALLKNSLDRVYTEQFTFADRRSVASFNNLDWQLGDAFTLTTGLRVTREERRTSQNKLVTDYGFGADLNPGAYGGFNSNNAGALTTNTPEQLAIADAVALRYFGVASYGALTAEQQAQVAAAKALRASNAFNQLHETTAAEPYEGTLRSGIVSLRYRINDDLTSYVSWQRGVKAGISQISGVDTNGVPISRLVAPERSDSYEIGIKGDYLDGDLTLNASIYSSRLHNFQQTVFILDPILTEQTGTSTYTSISGNAPLVEVQGLEIDAVYLGIKNFALRFAGAWNDAHYADSVLLAQPVENSNLAVRFVDANGRRLQNAPRFSGSLTGQYSVPVRDRIFHINFNYSYIGSHNKDAAQSRYGWVDGYGLMDFGIGLGRRDGLFDINFTVKNLFDKEYVETQTWSSFTPGRGRWYGIGVNFAL